MSSKPQQPKGGPATPKNLSEKQLRRIWTELKPQPFLERLRGIDTNARWQLQGYRISGCCPFHNDSTPSFHIYLDRGYAKCFGCDTYVWNPVELWSKLRRCGYSEALQDLRQAFGLKFLAASVQAQLREWDRNQLVKKTIMRICHDELLQAAERRDDPNYAEAQEAVEWLLKGRQIPKEALYALDMLGVMPPLGRFLRTLAEELAIENHRREEDAAKTETKFEPAIDISKDVEAYLEGTGAWRGAVVFRLDIAPGVIGRLKMRRAGMPASESRFIDDRFEEDLGFLGLGWHQYRPMLGTGEVAKYVRGVYIVEGEFDALSIMARQALTGAPGFVVVATGGAAQDGGNIDELRAFGFTEGYLFADRPGDKAGEKLIQHWLPQVKHLHAYIFTGYDRFPAQCSDPDNVVCAVGLDELAKYLLDTENRALFQTPPDWVFDLARGEIEACQDARTRIETAGSYGRLLRNKLECDLYVEACAKAYNLNAAQLTREIVAREEDEPGFILRLVDVLTQEFFPFGQAAEDGARGLYLWHKARREVVRVNLADDASIERELGNKVGPAYQFFAEKVGIPHFLEVPDVVKEQGKYLQKQDKDFRWYTRQALTIMSQTAPDYATATHKGQGLHVDADESGGPPVLYAVNGRDVYRGTYGAQDKLAWSKIEGPAYQDVIFDVGVQHVEKPWMSKVKDVNDLLRAEDLDPQDIWARLNPVLDVGWSFKNHGAIVEFLTAHLMATTINNAFRRQVVVHFCADTSAGKSKLNLGLIAGVEDPRLHLIEAAHGMQLFTPAGIRQVMHNKPRPLCLDEFEDDGPGSNTDKKARAVAETLEMVRNLTGGQNEFTMGSRDGERKIYKLFFFLFLSAIAIPRKVQDANRMIRIDMDRKMGRGSPQEMIQQELGWAHMKRLKTDLTIGLFPHIARIQRNYDELEAEFAKPGARPARVDERFFQALYPAMSVMKLIGRDYRKWATEFCDAVKPASTTNESENTDSQQLYNWLMQSQEIVVHGENGHVQKCSAYQMLADPQLREQLSHTGSGLFYDEPAQLLVVNWTAAIQTILHKHQRYGREMNVTNLREIANRAPYAVKNDDLLRSGALARLKGFGVSFMSTNQISAYRVKHIVEGEDDMPALVAPEPKLQLVPQREVQSDDGNFSA